MPFLKKVTGDPAGQIINLDVDSLVIGRSPECHIVLDPHGVSRRHAEIRREGEAFIVADLRSRNRTKINNVDLLPGRDHTLKQGDRINICDVEFIFYVKHPNEVEKKPKPKPSDELVVTDGPEESTIHELDASRADLLASMVRPEAKLKAIIEITRNLSSAIEIDSVAPKVLDTLFDLFQQSERAFLILKDPESKKLIRKAFKHRPARTTGRPALGLGPAIRDEPPTSISRSIVNHVLDQRKAILSQDAGHDPNLPTSASIADLKIRSVMCVPLLTPDSQPLGILQLDTSDRKQFGQEDLDLLVAVASQAAIAIQNARMHEDLLARERLDRDLRLAEQVQKRFLPQGVPEVAGFQFFAHYNAAYEVGGDYYDFVPLGMGRLAVALGDVSGKGVAAALMMAKFSGDTRYCILTEGAPGPAADALNGLLCAAGIEEKFITMSLGVLDLASRRLTLCSAGHLPVLIRRASGQVEEVGPAIAGFPLGILVESQYRQVDVTLEPGDVVVVYSDGVTDARNPANDPYDSTVNHRLTRRVADSPGGPEAVGRAILQEIREFSAGQKQFDDITLVCYGPTA
jgi:serine phosphatase RsbU (regulator of sigma subunit)/pSer/pThr/pTyr-binding forkhead associated (FHA) protein